MKLNDKKLQSITSELIDWIRKMMQATGGSRAVLGISGGKDSSVAAALCKEAVGGENVLGVLMPNGIQADIGYAYEIVKYLRIPNIQVPITSIVELFHQTISTVDTSVIPNLSTQTILNLPPRVRMTLLYGLAQSMDSCRIINTSNLSEDWIGYATVYGDTAGAFSPLGALTTDEVVQIGRYLEIPEKFIIKPPADGLTGKTDEAYLGFTYDVLNRYIREGEIEDTATKEHIDVMHQRSRFKFEPIPVFKVDLPVKI